MNLLETAKLWLEHGNGDWADQHAKEIKSLCQKFLAQDALLREAIAVIEFYGKPDNWETVMSYGAIIEAFKPVKTFGNAKAQAFLAKISGGENMATRTSGTPLDCTRRYKGEGIK